MDTRAGLDGYGKSRPPPGFDSRTDKPVASRYPRSHLMVYDYNLMIEATLEI